MQKTQPKARRISQETTSHVSLKRLQQVSFYSCLLLFVFICCYTILFLIEASSTGLIVSTLTLIPHVVALWLLKSDRFEVGRFLFVLVVNSFVFHMYIVLGIKANTEFFIPLLIIIPYYIFDRNKERATMITSMLFPIALWVTAFFLDFKLPGAQPIPAYIPIELIRFGNIIAGSAILFLIIRKIAKIYGRLEQNIVQEKRSVEQSKKSKNDLILHLAHEIRTPLQIISGNMTVLEHSLDKQLNVQQEKFIDSINTSTKHLTNLTNNILDFAKFESGKLHLASKNISTNQLIEDMNSLFRLMMSQKGLVFSISQSNNVPDSFIGDEQRIRQILINLIGNSMKYTNSGFVRLSVSYFQQKLFFEIDDSGIGIPPEKLDSIFKAFEQVDDEASIFGRTGLGLTLSLQLARLMKGDILVESKLGTGSTFTFYIPAK